jgi:uncharacterized membrane-anchored protein YhcB (DUF1043 family)
MGMLSIMAGFLGLIVIGIYFMSKGIGNVSPNKKQVQKDLKKLKEDMDTWIEDLVPITKGDLELFSLNQLKQTVKKNVAYTAKGIYTTIFNEPIVAYSYKKYASRKNKLDALLYARTANHEYAYRIKDDSIQIVIDNRLIGSVNDKGELVSANNRKKIAKLSSATDNTPIHIGDREVANVVNQLPAGKKDLNQRAFEFVTNDLNKEEENLLMSLATLELVQRSIK